VLDESDRSTNVSDDELFSREEILSGGFSRVRRARALLYLIEQEADRVAAKRANITAASMDASFGFVMLGDEQTMRGDLPGEKDAAFIESFRNARRHAYPATVKALASNAYAWKVLLPDDLALRAEVLHQMALRHEMPANKSKPIATTFGVGTPEFDDAYRTTVGDEVSTAFAPDTGLLASWKRRRAAR
jgi:hypothetical protein